MLCPFVEQADPRCAEHFSLFHLDDAFTHCVGRYQFCPVYQRLTREPSLRTPAAGASAVAAANRLAG